MGAQNSTRPRRPGRPKRKPRGSGSLTAAERAAVFREYAAQHAGMARDREAALAGLQAMIRRDFLYCTRAKVVIEFEGLPALEVVAYEGPGVYAAEIAEGQP